MPQVQKDQLDGLLALKLVAEKLNFSAAAMELGVSPSAVSQAIKQLETRVGVALLSRTTRSTSLTEAGKRFLGEAGPALDQILSALENVGTYAEKPSGMLRINLPRILYPAMIPLVLSFKKKYPDVTVELFFDDDLADVVGSGFDAGIRISEMMAKDMVAVKLLGPVRFVIAGSPRYFAKMGRPKHPKDLLWHDCIRIRIGTSEFYDRWEFESKGKEFQVQVSGSMILNDPVVMLEAASAGAGLIYSPEEFVHDLVKSGKLEIVLSPYAAVSDGFYLYYPKRSQVLPKLRAFVEHCRG